MKKILLFAVLVGLSSCNPTDDMELNTMAKPVIVIGNSIETNTQNGSIVLRDKNGRFATFYTSTPLGKVLVESYKKGDTIK